ncbi:MAG: aminotransferase class III-fold pyridoxal phosphate-dependent enzyme [Pseudomonadota bacterium]
MGAGLSGCTTAQTPIGPAEACREPVALSDLLEQRLSFDRLMALHREHFSEDQLTFIARLGVNLLYGERKGARVYDRAGDRWLYDCHRMGSTYSLGHRHPEVVATLRDGLDHLDLGNWLLMSEYRQEAAHKLIATTNGDFAGIVYTASGSEANESAMKAARDFTGRSRTVYFEGAYHGDTLMTLAVGGDEARKRRYRMESANCHGVPFNDIESLKRAVTPDTACLIAEPAISQAGFTLPDPGFWPRVAAHCRAMGAVLILDEVQTGGSATGDFWYYQSLGFVPDILVSGKWPSGGIFPNSFALFREDIHKHYTKDVFHPHPTTFGGSDLGCLVTSKVIDLLSDPDLQARVRRHSEAILSALAPLDITVNAAGLCMGLHDARASSLDRVAQLAEVGILTVPALHDPNIVEFRPMLTLSEAELDAIIAGLVRVYG